MTIISEKVKWKDITSGGNIEARGNSEEFITGDWRIMIPEYYEKKCKQCLLCIPVCPDSAIYMEGEKRKDFNFDHCKGCGVCAEVCPFNAIEMFKDKR